MKASFKATTPGGAVITWDDEHGFTGDVAELLNSDMQWAPGQTHTPLAIVARGVLLEQLPGCTITDFVSVPLPPLKPGAMC